MVAFNVNGDDGGRDGAVVQRTKGRNLSIAACSTVPPPKGLGPEEAQSWNLAQAAGLVASAAAQGAEIACLPEAFHRTGAARSLPLEDIPEGPTAAWCADLARKYQIHLIAPLVGILDGVPRNSAAWFDTRGNYGGAYCKVHLTSGEMESGLVPGDVWTVFQIPCREAGTVRAGAFICFDINFPEAARLLALHGAELLFHPTVYSMYGEVGWEAVLRARAIDNCVYICTVNHGIQDEDPWMPGMCLGRSGIVGPDGLTLVETGRYAGVALATVDLARPRLVRAFGVTDSNFRHEMWRHRQPHTYGALATYGAYIEKSDVTPAYPPAKTSGTTVS
jgi:predicted amidohydrolase